jgi:hypothetical protein
MAYERKALDQTLPFDQLKARSLINESAKAANHDPDFSQRIREPLPGFRPGAEIFNRQEADLAMNAGSRIPDLLKPCVE